VGLLAAGPADAASRGYRLDNKSSHDLKLESAKPLPGFVCNASICVETGQPMDFEGRPANGSVLTPEGAPHAWELRYSFGHTYAAQLKYAIVGTHATVEYTIETLDLQQRLGLQSRAGERRDLHGPRPLPQLQELTPERSLRPPKVACRLERRQGAGPVLLSRRHALDVPAAGKPSASSSSRRLSSVASPISSISRRARSPQIYIGEP